MTAYRIKTVEGEVFQISFGFGVEPLEFVTGRTYVREYGLGDGFCGRS